ncbi:hypothetical protein ACFELO_03795 [Oceanicaulis sp. LC35]|uniref:hypothetical protein n=1 Tax=Oceanicaulis sp. LC35 TaxID=3349635 RepID=UPI003F834658
MLKMMLAAFAAAMPLQSALAQTGAETEAELPGRLDSYFQMTPETLEGYAPEGNELGMTTQLFSFVGREDLTQRLQENAYRRPACSVLREDGLQAVVEAVGDARVVMINEAHDDPYHRWVIARLAEALAPDFTVFAAETFSNEGDVETLVPEASMDIGWYSGEPIYGRQLRTLVDLGYRFAAYEITQEQRLVDPSEGFMASIAEREEAQAVNFIANALEAYPDARILVHVGYAHLSEVGGEDDDDTSRWFAARLRDKTGIDPLTITQTSCNVESGAPIAALTESPLVDGSNLPDTQRQPGWVDLFLGRPPMSFTDGRPDWRYEIGDKPVAVPEDFLAEEGRVIIEARAPGEDLEMIPVERLMLYPGETLPLLLPEGEWVLTAWTEDGAFGDPVTVSAPSAP